ncbi:MAG: hypothetical protein Q8O56_02180 [Solirubrobacteraceae bacterium]|nr:hypothetical protein [Solirubrobacteraceae bacterium]
MPGGPGYELRLRDGSLVRLAPAALDPVGERARIDARDPSGRTVGRAAYARVYGLRAELSLEVDDARWHAGLPEELLAALCEVAAARGVATLLVRARPSDMRLLALLRNDFGARETSVRGHVELELATEPRRCIGRDDACARQPARHPAA